MKKSLIVFLILAISLNAQAKLKDTICLSQCHKLAVANHPLHRQLSLLNASMELKIKALNNNYLPQFDLNATATYQSDVTEVSISIPANPVLDPESISFPSIDKDSYKMTLDVNQLIWDGGRLAGQKSIEEAAVMLDKSNVEIELYKLKENVNEAYFSILLLKKAKEILIIKHGKIKAALNEVNSAVVAGMALQSSANELMAESIAMEQKVSELDYGIKSAFEILSELVGQQIVLDNELENTEVMLPSKDVMSNSRPEVRHFELQKTHLDAMDEFIQSADMPAVYGFAQLGYGKPGLNMLSDNFDAFYMVGIRLNWNLWDWRKSRIERQHVSLNREMIGNQKESVDKGVFVKAIKSRNDYIKFGELMIRDQEIISLRENVSMVKASQLKNGSITVSDFISVINSEAEARYNYEYHKLQRNHAGVDYYSHLGDMDRIN